MIDTLVIGGSNSSTSINQAFGQNLAQQAKYDYFDTRTLDIPLYSIDLENVCFPDSLIDFYNRLKKYRNIIIVCPEYNGYAPAFFKSITDWLSRYERFYFENQNIFIIGVTPGKMKASSVRESLSKMFGYTGANILGTYGVGLYDEQADYTKTNEEIINMINEKTR